MRAPTVSASTLMSTSSSGLTISLLLLTRSYLTSAPVWPRARAALSSVSSRPRPPVLVVCSGARPPLRPPQLPDSPHPNQATSAPAAPGLIGRPARPSARMFSHSV
ncbi:hypothetical protein C8Q76DRAFT_722639 [Earliella scabrosa]|nr:hypothetical protein C8Q76DRAFT_722639 [Earliella scabrosa]